MSPSIKGIGPMQNNFSKSETAMKGKFILTRGPKVMTPSAPVKIMEDVDLEEALDLAGAGKYQLIHCVLMLLAILSTMFEMIGIAFVLPAAACDLQLPEGLRGIVTSIPNIGIILTAPFWGRATDSQGRKPVLMFSSAVAGLLALLAAFIPNLTGFALCKFASSLFLSCPSSIGFAYACEFLPKKRRDFTVLIGNGLLMLLSILCPVFAWLILPYQWRLEIGLLVFRPWRLLTVVYSLPLLIVAVWTYYADESPKFLFSKGRWDDAVAVLRKVYAANTGLSENDYCVKSLKRDAETDSIRDINSTEGAPSSRMSSMALLRTPHLKWLALTGFLMFGLFSLLNGLFLLAPDTINKVMSESSGDVGTVCTLVNRTTNTTVSADSCVDTISKDTFQIVVVTSIIYGIIVVAGSLSPLSKRTLLVIMYTIVGIACLVSGLTTNRILAGAAMSSLQLTSLGIGPLTAYVVQLFPTNLRGTALGAVMMFGRVGSAAGANAAGFFLAVACTATFYGFSGLLFLCAAMSFLLPTDSSRSDPTTNPST